MREQSIISSFIVVLGNFVLHFSLAFLSTTVEEPTQEEMDMLSKELTEGDYTCVSVADLETAKVKAYNLHLAAFILLLYFHCHTWFWSRIASFCKANKLCCFSSTPIKVLEKPDISTLETYSLQMKTTLKLLEDGEHNSQILAENDKDLLNMEGTFGARVLLPSERKAPAS